MMNRRFLYFSIACLLLVAVTGIALAQTNGYDLTWWTVDGGGGSATGGSYTLSGTIGQPDAGNLSNGDYTLTGGFWGGVSGASPPGPTPTPTPSPTPPPTGTQFIYLPLVIR